MQGIRPENLTTSEILRYATLAAPSKIPPNWVAEIVRRLERLHDAPTSAERVKAKLTSQK